MNNRYYYISTIFICLLFSEGISNADAQNLNKAGKIYHLGDTLPEINAEIEHYGKPVFSLMELRDKYVIFDLWNVYCSNCIAAMPRLESLRDRYADKLEIVKVTRDGLDKLEALYKRSDIARESKLPSIINDTIVSSMIDVRYFPSYIFIDKNGVIKHVTGQFSDEDLEDFINGKPTKIKNHESIVLMSHQNPFIIEWYPYLTNNFEGQSYLARLDKRFRTAGIGGIHQDKSGKISRLTFTATGFKDLYMEAYDFRSNGAWEMSFSRSRVLVETEAKEELLYDSTGDRQSYVYELRLKQPAHKSTFHKFVQSQLDLYFNVVSMLEKRVMPCYILKRISDVNLAAKDTVLRSDTFKEENRYVRKYVNWQPIRRQIGNALPYQLYDESGIDPKLPVDIEFFLTPEDLPKMNKQLSKYGLTIEKSEREMDVVVIRD